MGGKQIARVQIHGLITNDERRLELIKRVADSPRVAAVILDVNSPGGTTTGGEALYVALRKLAKKKPVVAVFGTMATSAAYIVGLASDRIITRGNTVTGSVGVIFQWAEVHELLNKLGIKMNEVKSGALKANPSMFAPLDEKGRRIAQELVADSHNWFLGLVRERRGIEPRAIDGLADGRVFSGRQAVALKLADQIGGEEEAVRWLIAERGVEEDLEIKTWRPERELLDGSGFARAIGGLVREALGLDWLAKLPGPAALGRLALDGLVSVWHPRTS